MEVINLHNITLSSCPGPGHHSFLKLMGASMSSYLDKIGLYVCSYRKCLNLSESEDSEPSSSLEGRPWKGDIYDLKLYFIVVLNTMDHQNAQPYVITLISACTQKKSVFFQH